MGKNRDMARKFAAEISKELRKQMDETAEPMLRAQAIRLVALILQEMDGFKDVTGNTKNSIVVGLYYDKRLKYVASSADLLNKPALRPTLKKGEAYNLPQYWDGRYHKKGVVYVGETGDENYVAATEAMKRIKSKTTTFNTHWSYIILTAVKYASYLEQHKNASVISNAWDDLKGAGAMVGQMRFG